MTARRDGRARIVHAATVLAARQGADATTVRAIAESAGLTEAALYRHFASKDELYQRIYAHIVGEMLVEKERIVAGPGSIREKLAAWIQVSYERYDHDPDGFTLILLRPRGRRSGDEPVEPRSQGELLLVLIRAGQKTGQLRPMDPELALSHFIGLMLAVPQRINEGILPPPASQYQAQVAEAVWRVLRADGVA